MTTRSRIVILFAGLALTAGGCANGSVGESRGAPPPARTSTSGCPTTLTITAADSGKTVCVALGGTVNVDLSSPDGSRWQPLEVGGSGLTQKGTPSPSPGGQSATLDATAVGTAMITSGHRACPSSPGTMSCNAIVAWTATVDVKS